MQKDGPSKDISVEVQLRWNHRKVQVSPKALVLRKPEHNLMIKDITHVNVDLSMTIMFLLHNIQ